MKRSLAVAAFFLVAADRAGPGPGRCRVPRQHVHDRPSVLPGRGVGPGRRLRRHLELVRRQHAPSTEVKGQRYAFHGRARGRGVRRQHHDVGIPVHEPHRNAGGDAAGRTVRGGLVERFGDPASSIAFQRFEANGTPAGAGVPRSSSVGDSYYANVDIAANGTFVVVWSADRPDNGRVRAEVSTPRAIASARSFRVNSTLTGIQTAPRVSVE